jgi:hypothetical protein
MAQSLGSQSQVARELFWRGQHATRHNHCYHSDRHYPQSLCATFIYRVSQEEWVKLRESVPYVKLYRYNPKYLYPKLNGYGDNGHRKVWSSLRFHALYLVCDVIFGYLPALENDSSLVNVVSSVLAYEAEWLVKSCKMLYVFSHVESCDMHFVYGFCNGSARAAVEEHQRHFPDWRIPSTRVFTRIHQTLCDTGCLPSFAIQSERPVVGTINTRENILEMVQRSPHLSTRRMASRIGVSRMQVLQTLHEENLYPYHDQMVQHLEPGDHAQRMDLCHSEQLL